MRVPECTGAAPQCTAGERAQAACCELQRGSGVGSTVCVQVQGRAALHEGWQGRADAGRRSARTGQVQGSIAQRDGRAGAGQRSTTAGAGQGSMRAGARQRSVSAAAEQCRLVTGAGRRCEPTGDCQHPCGGVLALQRRMVTTSVCCELAAAHAQHTLQLATQPAAQQAGCTAGCPSRCSAPR